MLIESKSNLAKLMATENIIVEQRSVPTAYFNLENRVLVIPTLKSGVSNTLFDLFIGHEVGHALFTPTDGWHDSIKDLGVNRSILNVCEDVRIEKKIQRKYPGLKTSFIKAYRELLDQDFFGVQGKDLNLMNLIDRINLHTKCGASLGIQFNKQEKAFVEETMAAESFEETVTVAKKIQDYMQSQKDSRKNDEEEELDMELEGLDEVESGYSGDFSDEEDEEEGESFFGASDGDEEMEESRSNQDSGVESQTDNKFREREKELFVNSNNTYKDPIYANIPDFDVSKHIVDYKPFYQSLEEKMKINHYTCDNYFASFRKETNKVVGYLVKEFELRRNAQQLKRVGVSKMGDLNMNKIYSYQFNEDIFKRIASVPKGKSHGLVLFLDWSGSMNSYLHDTIKQLLTLTLFCKKVSIPFEVYAFSDRVKDDYRSEIRYKDGDLKLHDFVLNNILSSRMNSADFSKAANYLLWQHMSVVSYQFNLGGTPLNESIISAMKIVPEFRNKYKLQIVNTVFLTDGEGYALTQAYDSKKGGYNTSHNIVVRDPVTCASIRSDYNYTNNSKAFLYHLKQRTGCNVIGFRILNNRDLRCYLREAYKGMDYEPIIEKFKKEKSTSVKSFGFDEYFLLKSDKLDTEADDELEITSTNTRSIVTSFKNFNKNRIGNRVILNRFVDLIS